MIELEMIRKQGKFAAFSICVLLRRLIDLISKYEQNSLGSVMYRANHISVRIRLREFPVNIRFTQTAIAKRNIGTNLTGNFKYTFIKIDSKL